MAAKWLWCNRQLTGLRPGSCLLISSTILPFHPLLAELNYLGSVRLLSPAVPAFITSHPPRSPAHSLSYLPPSKRWFVRLFSALTQRPRSIKGFSTTTSVSSSPWPSPITLSLGISFRIFSKFKFRDSNQRTGVRALRMPKKCPHDGPGREQTPRVITYPCAFVATSKQFSYYGQFFPTFVSVCTTPDPD